MNRFDVCEAYYIFYSEYHRSGLTRRCMTRRTISEQLNRMRFRPSPMLRYESLSEEGKMIYEALVEKWEPEAKGD